MGIDYYFSVRIGFALPADKVEAPFITSTEQKYHYEDRYDPKTDIKIKPIKVIDQQGKIVKWFEIKYQEETYTSLYQVINETNFFQNKLGCEVSYSSTDGLVYFYLPTDCSNIIDYGRITISNAMVPLSFIEENKEKLNQIRENLNKEFGTDPGRPAILIESNVG